MNECCFMGNITHDPELKEVGSGTKVLNFSIAVSRSYKKNTGETVKEVTYIPLEAWDSGAETIHRHFKKGDPIIVFCSAKTEKWTDKDGKNRSQIRFRVNKFEFLLSKRKPDVDVNEDRDDEQNESKTGDIPF